MASEEPDVQRSFERICAIRRGERAPSPPVKMPLLVVHVPKVRLVCIVRHVDRAYRIFECGADGDCAYYSVYWGLRPQCAPMGDAPPPDDFIVHAVVLALREKAVDTALSQIATYEQQHLRIKAGNDGQVDYHVRAREAFMRLQAIPAHIAAALATRDGIRKRRRRYMDIQEPELAALATVLRRPIVVHSIGIPTLTYPPTTPSDAGAIELLYTPPPRGHSNGHYRLMLPLRPPSTPALHT